MSAAGKPIMILYAEDDEEDRMLTEMAFKRTRLSNDLRFVADGQELMEYLFRHGAYTDPATSPMPGIILLDLNMPIKDGRVALTEIKSEPSLRRIPVVVLTTSKEEEDIMRTYTEGANSYITKPVTLEKLIEVVETIGRYWFQIVELPNGVPE